MWGAGGGGVGRERSREEEVFEGRSEGRKEKVGRHDRKS